MIENTNIIKNLSRCLQLNSNKLFLKYIKFLNNSVISTNANKQH